MNYIRWGSPGCASAMAAAWYPNRGCTSPCAKVQKCFERDLVPRYLRGFGVFSPFL